MRRRGGRQAAIHRDARRIAKESRRSARFVGMAWLLAAVFPAAARGVNPLAAESPSEPPATERSEPFDTERRGRVDLAPFGHPISGPGFAGIEWRSPREVREVHVRSERALPAPESLRLEWWGSVWPAHGSGGWMKLDDRWNGRWVKAEVTPVREAPSAALILRFAPLSRAEWEKAPGKPPAEPTLFRRTSKVRIVRSGGEEFPDGLRLSAFGRSTWREGSFDIEAKLSEDGTRTCRLEILNGVLLDVSSLPPPRRADVQGDRFELSGIAGSSGGVRARLRYTENRDLNSNDLTRVTLRFGASSSATGFSFVPQDVLKAGEMRFRDFALLIVPTGSSLTLANDPGPPPTAWRRSVRQRVAERAEATYESAMAGIPRLSPPRWVPLGVPSARQEVFVGPRGDWSFKRLSIGVRFPGVYEAGRDSRRIPYRTRDENPLADEFLTLLDTSAAPRFNGEDRQDLQRYLEEDDLPWIHVSWRTGAVRFHQELGTTILLGDYGDDVTRRGDETVLLLVRLTVTNTADASQMAHVNLRYSHGAPIRVHEDGIIAIEPAERGDIPEGLHALRGQISMDEPAGGGAAGWRSEPGIAPEGSALLRWNGALGPGETRSIYFKAPFVDLLDDEEIDRLRTIRYDDERRRVLEYWRERLARGMRIEVPVPALNHLYRANLWHNVITTDRDPTTGLYNQGVATVRYGVFANETVMVARSMDLRGEHLEAERYLEPLLRYQGREALTGRFTTKEGVFHSAGPYTHGQYAMNHGFVLWGVADHYLLTRDRAYLERVAPKLIRGCEFLIEERKATMGRPGEARSEIHGLAPASSLEDVIEFQHWFATNGYFHLGMKRAAEALAAAGHPQATRIAREAELYRRDIERRAREATTRAAAVPLRNGYYIPYVPSRVGQWRHLTEGWIREALYPALHLATAEVVSPRDPLITWMLDDLEDNIFFSRQSGYDVEDHERSWFERGGVTLQPCLLDTAPTYLARDEIPAALRSFWNTYALSIYPDVHCFAEWARRFGVGGGPVYKTSDESRFILWLRALLIWESDSGLWFGRGVPRAWLQDGGTVRIENAPTRFGAAGMVIRSSLANGTIQVTLDLPTRHPPGEIWLRLRHLQGMHPRRVAVNSQSLSSERIVGEDVHLTPGRDLQRAARLEITAHYRDS